MSLYVEPMDDVLWSYSFDATTPEVIYGSTEESLYTEAVEEWGALLNGIPLPIQPLMKPEFD